MLDKCIDSVVNSGRKAFPARKPVEVVRPDFKIAGELEPVVEVDGVVLQPPARRDVGVDGVVFGVTECNPVACRPLKW